MMVRQRILSRLVALATSICNTHSDVCAIAIFSGAADDIPSREEVEALRNLEDVTVDVSFLDNTSVPIKVFDDTTAAELLEAVCDEQNLLLTDRCAATCKRIRASISDSLRWIAL